MTTEAHDEQEAPEGTTASEPAAEQGERQPVPPHARRVRAIREQDVADEFEALERDLERVPARYLAQVGVHPHRDRGRARQIAIE